MNRKRLIQMLHEIAKCKADSGVRNKKFVPKKEVQVELNPEVNTISQQR